jgi:hypothetical protein
MPSTLPDRQAWIRLPVILAIGGAVAWAGSQGSERVAPAQASLKHRSLIEEVTGRRDPVVQQAAPA